MKNVSNLLWGFVLIFIGVIFGLNAMEITSINIFFDGWWTLFIIVPCFIGLFNEKDRQGNMIGLVIGVCLLLGCLDLIDFVIISKLIIPFILVMIGLSLVFKNSFNNKIKKEISKLNKDGGNEYFATFGGQSIDFGKEKFKSCGLNAIFGGIKCDLREVIVDGDALVNVSAIFGGVTIYVPDNVSVKVSSTPIFGGVNNHKKKGDKEVDSTIYINALCMFGGVDIK